jgi:hypothetical protein
VGATVVATAVAGATVVASTGAGLEFSSEDGEVAAGAAVAASTLFSTTTAVVAGVTLLGAGTVDVVAGANVPSVVDGSVRRAIAVPTTTVRPLGCCTIAPRKARPSRIQTVASAAWPRLMIDDVPLDAGSEELTGAGHALGVAGDDALLQATPSQYRQAPLGS